MTKMTGEWLKKIEEREKYATDGPWKSSRWMVSCPAREPQTPWIVDICDGGVTMLSADIDFIAHSRQDIPALTTVLRELLGLVQGYCHDDKCNCLCCGRRIDECKKLASKGGCKVGYVLKRFEGVSDAK